MAYFIFKLFQFLFELILDIEVIIFQFFLKISIFVKQIVEFVNFEVKIFFRNIQLSYFFFMAENLIVEPQFFLFQNWFLSSEFVAGSWCCHVSILFFN